MHVVELGLTALKGTRHLARDEVGLDRHGPVGDRDLCLVDVAAQRVLRTVQHPSLLSVRVVRSGDELDVELPDGRRATGSHPVTGEHVTCDYWGRPVDLALVDGPHSALLSEHLGRPVALARAPRGGVVYGAPVSLVGLASVRDLAERTGRPDLLASTARWRLTMVVDAGPEPYAEDRWLGRTLHVGDAVVRLERPVARCGVVDLDPATGEKDGSLLKALAGCRPATAGSPWLGVDARVLTPGVVRRGADCTVGASPSRGTMDT